MGCGGRSNLPNPWFFPNIFCVRSALPSVAFRRNPLTHTQLHTQTTYSHTTFSHTHNFLSHTHNFLSHTHTTLSHTHNSLSHTATLTHTTLSHTHTLCSRRGTYGTGLPLLARLGHVAVCVAGVAFGSVDVHSVWQAWHLVTSTSLCVAGVALMALGWLWWRACFCGRRGIWKRRRRLHFVWQVWQFRARSCDTPCGEVCCCEALCCFFALPCWHGLVDLLQYCFKHVQTDLELSMMCCRFNFFSCAYLLQNCFKHASTEQVCTMCCTIGCPVVLRVEKCLDWKINAYLVVL